MLAKRQHKLSACCRPTEDRGRRHIRRLSGSPSHACRFHGAHLLRGLSHALAALEPLPEIGQAFATELERRLQLNSCVLVTYVEPENLIRFHAAIIAGDVEEWAAASASDDPFAQLFRKRELTVIPAGTLCDQSLLAFPLIFGGTALGVLAVGPAERGKRYRRVLGTCAELLATASYVQSHAEMLAFTYAEHSTTLAGISEIAQELNATLDTEAIVEHVLLHALAIPTVDAGAILMLMNDGLLSLAIHRGVDRSFVMAQAARPLSLADFEGFDLNQEYQLIAVDQVPADLRIRSEARAQSLLPLRREGRLCGLLIENGEREGP